MSHTFNIAERLRESAERYPFQRAVVFPTGRDWTGRVAYTHLTFQQLDRESDRLARGLCRMGVQHGSRLVLMVRPSLEFVSLVFAIFKTGGVVVLIDPGMGRSNIFQCLQDVDPDGFVAIPLVQAVRSLKSRRFPHARWNVTVGRPMLTRHTYQSLRGEAWTPFAIARTQATDPAAVIFTSGSTGRPKGVTYEHGMFGAQVELLRGFYGIEPGEIDLSSFPLFALFNSGMGVTTVIPEMDAARPADADPAKIVAAIHDLGITQAFGSPALWNRVGRYCEQRGIELPSVKRVFSAGAPVPLHVLQRMKRALTRPAAEMHTPYGATESLPVCSISAGDVLERTAEKSRRGAGTCVGRPFPRIAVKIIEIIDGPIASMSGVRELPTGEPGEIVVQGPSVTREYFRKPEATCHAKIPDGDRFWHRTGDVGYLDGDNALWFCGRKAQIVETENGRLLTVPCEAIFNEHPRVYRSALVGRGPTPAQQPVIVIEPEEGRFPKSAPDRARFTRELLELAATNPLTAEIATVLYCRSLPVDRRHNVKIDRERLAKWAAKVLNRASPAPAVSGTSVSRTPGRLAAAGVDEFGNK